MSTFVLVVHLIICVALVIVVLLQRTEGGALGIGGGQSGGMGSMFSGRGQASTLTRATALLAACFFVTSITLTILAEIERGPPSLLPGEPVGPADPLAPLLPIPGDRPTPGVGTPAPAADAPAPAPATPPADTPAGPGAPAGDRPAGSGGQ